MVTPVAKKTKKAAALSTKVKKAHDLIRGDGIKRLLEKTNFSGKVWAGVDPGGSSGGSAFVLDHGTHCNLIAVPTNGLEPRDRFLLFDAFQPFLEEVALEWVWSTPNSGVSSSFVFGQDVGAWVQLCACLDVPCTQVTPAGWQSWLGLPNLEDEAALRGIVASPSPEKGRLSNNWKYALRKKLLGELAKEVAPPELFLWGACNSSSYDAILIARHLLRARTGRESFLL